MTFIKKQHEYLNSWSPVILYWERTELSTAQLSPSLCSLPRHEAKLGTTAAPNCCLSMGYKPTQAGSSQTVSITTPHWAQQQRLLCKLPRAGDSRRIQHFKHCRLQQQDWYPRASALKQHRAEALLWLQDGFQDPQGSLWSYVQFEAPQGLPAWGTGWLVCRHRVFHMGVIIISAQNWNSTFPCISATI